jgi:hypothetical protein
MKTITEFPSMNLKNAVKLKQELMAGGKTAEELAPALGESLKLEGDRLNWMMAAVELVEKKLEDIKRVVVYSLAEGEKPSGHVVQKGEHCYLVEYYTSMNKKPVSDRDQAPVGRGGRDGKRGKRGERNDRAGGNDRPQNPRGPQAGPRPVGTEGAPSGGGGRRDANRPRRSPAPAAVDPSAPRRAEIKPLATPIARPVTEAAPVVSPPTETSTHTSQE